MSDEVFTKAFFDKLLAQGIQDQVRRAWFNLDRQARQARRKSVIKMGAEIARIERLYGISALGLAEIALEGVIEGDVPRIRSGASMLTFAEEKPPYGEEMAARFADFRKLCAEAAAAIDAENREAAWLTIPPPDADENPPKN